MLLNFSSCWLKLKFVLLNDRKTGRRVGRDQDFGQKVSDGFLRAAAGKGRSYTFVGVEVESNLVFCVSVSNLSPSTSSSSTDDDDDDDVDGRRPTSAQKLLLVPQHLSFSGRSTEISVPTGGREKKNSWLVQKLFDRWVGQTFVTL